MEVSLIKYLAFIIGSTLVMGLLLLWLKANKVKRKQKEKQEENLEIQKEMHKKALREIEEKRSL